MPKVVIMTEEELEKFRELVGSGDCVIIAKEVADELAKEGIGADELEDIAHKYEYGGNEPDVAIDVAIDPTHCFVSQCLEGVYGEEEGERKSEEMKTKWIDRNVPE